jgi:glycolate oxidase
VDALIERAGEITKQFSPTEVRISKSDAARERLWRGRKAAFGAMRKIARDVYVTDGIIPSAQLPEILLRIESLSKRYGLEHANYFHAGDGNLYPMVLFDSAKPGELEKAVAFGADILKVCVDLGGVLSGVHDVGIEKRDLMTYQFRAIDLMQQQYLKCAFDPQEMLNPGKVFPTPCGCVRTGRLPTGNGDPRFAGVPRF